MRRYVEASANTECEKSSGRRPGTCVDYRTLIEDDSTDAVAIATPDHWHALQTIWACQAGKDVYVEKVGGHSHIESCMMVDAAGKSKRVVQHGTQARSSANVQDGIEKLQQGVIGKVLRRAGHLSIPVAYHRTSRA